MKNILLVCAGGMSTSLMVVKMRAAAKEIDVEVNIDAVGISRGKDYIDKVDVILVGPQVRFQKPQLDALAKGRIPIEVMDMRLFGTMNGKAILLRALELIS